MRWLKRQTRSSDLTSGMMERLGIASARQLAAHPDLGAMIYEGAVLRCSGCPDQAGCARLQASTAKLAEPPSYCCNTDCLNWMARS